jgi:hypothetical protein
MSANQKLENISNNLTFHEKMVVMSFSNSKDLKEMKWNDFLQFITFIEKTRGFQTINKYLHAIERDDLVTVD